MSRFTPVPPAISPSNIDPVSDRDVRVSRTRQATFERGVALALAAGMLEELARLRSLTTGLRWLIVDEDAEAVRKWLDNLQQDILRAERIEERRERE